MVRFMSRLSIKIKEKAFDLRKNGYSVKEIANKLGIAKSTSSLWVRHIELNKKAQERLKKRRLLPYYKAGLRWQKKKIEEEQRYQSLALETVNKTKKDFSHNKLYCALLYWCEGGKGWKEGIRFVNSDPMLIQSFLKLFRSTFDVDEKKFHLLMHLHDYHDEQKQKVFWSNLTKIPKNQFYRTFHKSHTKKRIKENYPGCVALHYNNLKIARELKAIYKAFSRNLGTC